MITVDPRQSILPSFINYAYGLGGATCKAASLKTTRDQIEASCTSQDQKQTSILLLLHIINNYRGLREMLTVQPKSASRPEDMCLGRMLKGAEAKARQPFTRSKVEDILGGDIKGLIEYILKDTRQACSVCGTAVFDEGKKVAARNGYTQKELEDLEKTIDKKCPTRDKDKGKLELSGRARTARTLSALLLSILIMTVSVLLS
ncbi:hypothetical protein P389DRAFT_20194 [Cystobasidium minutum MCA 4210]|uniref:uncharacterized protein n=1 Tax=Cystobasidium minutum MCA 4210 TaxID=1397322 RepID=UPI0034CF7951|eukprot:jgi/Rhomi1/20194/CE20193_26